MRKGRELHTSYGHFKMNINGHISEGTTEQVDGYIQAGTLERYRMTSAYRNVGQNES